MQSTPDISALLKIAQSPAGQKLLAILQSGSSADLDRITAAAKAGNLEEAKEALNSMLASSDARQLLKELEQQL